MAQNVLLIHRSVPDAQVFLDSVNGSTCGILYSSSTTKSELMDMIQQKTNSVAKLGLVFVEVPFSEKHGEVWFTLIQELGVKHVDFLACNLLKDAKWKEFFGRLEQIGVVVGASNDRTGNLKYGGDWTMESTGQDIEQVYFTQSIEYYKYLLDVTSNTFFMKQDGLYGMGQNIYGHFASDGNPNAYSPIKITLPVPYTSRQIKQVAYSSSVTMVLLENGDLYGAGDNSEGQLGLATLVSNSHTFTLIDSGVDKVACGDYHTMIIKGNTLYGTGYNYFGELGLGDRDPRETFVQVTTGVTHVVCGFYHTMILKGNELYGAGKNDNGQLGVPSPSVKTSFNTSDPPIATGVDKISCGYAHTMILKGTTLWGSGNNYYGQVGPSGVGNDRYTFMEVDTGVNQVECGMYFTMILKGSSVYGIGENTDGQLGIGDNTSTGVFMPSDTNVSQIICGANCSIILKEGMIYGSGSNMYGKTGLGDQVSATNVFTPTSITGVLSLLKNGFTYVPPAINSTTCFPAGTMVKTDQGRVEIQKLRTGVHTLNGEPVALVDTFSMDKAMVCLEKDSIRKNYPSERTLVSRRHKIFYQGKMKAAQRFVGKHKGVSFVPYEGDKLYNVLLPNYGRMNVNGMLCETLHPINPIAKYFNPTPASSPVSSALLCQ